MSNAWDWVDPWGLAGCGSDAAKLTKNLGRGPLDHEAHHLVMSNSKDWRMEALRNKMDDLGISINSAENGIWLPKTIEDRLPNSLLTAHRGNGVHGNGYKQYIYDNLINSNSTDEFKARLQSIKKYLNSGNVFPLANGKIPTF